jgi:hypothetical protein
MMMQSRFYALTFMAVTAVGLPAQAVEWQAPGPNIALGKTYQLPKKPAYYLTNDAGDATQLTDGKFAPTANGMWFYRDTVGWHGFVTPMIFDLGSDQPIAGIGFNTEIGAHAGIGWPPAILIFVSNDNKAFHYAGELIALSSKFGAASDRIGRHFFRTDDLKTHGRYVQLVALTSIFTFVDEVEIYQGKPEFMSSPLPGAAIEEPANALYGNQGLYHKMPYAVAARLATDTARAARFIGDLKVKPELAAKLNAKLEELRVAAIKPDFSATYDEFDYRALAPLNPEHAKTFAVLSEAFRSVGYPEYSIWHSNRWERQSPFTLPTALVDGKLPEVKLDVKLLENDRRGEVLNIGNFTDGAKTAVVSVSGLPGGAQPSYLRVRSAEYIALQSRIWDADVLPLAEATGAGWNINLPAGMSRQIWLDFNIDAKVCPPGTYQGNIDIQVQGGPKLSVPIALTVAPYRLPEAKDKAVAVGVWDYVEGQGGGGMIFTDKNLSGKGRNNLDAVVKHLRESGINAPWGSSNWKPDGTFPRPDGTWFDAQGNLIKPLDFAPFDLWVSRFPDAKYYMIHAIAWWGYGGVGNEGEANPEAQRRLAVVMKKWAEHMRSKGIDPKRIVLLLVDEPQLLSQTSLTNFWAKTIKEAVPEFKLYIDPLMGAAYYEHELVQQMYEYSDMISPGTDYSYQNIGQKAVDFYKKWQEKGKIMGFYVCAQNPSEAESIRYYRLQEWACWEISGGGPESYSGFWSYLDVRGIKPWNQLAGSTADRSFCPAYIDSKGGTDGKHWLAIFEGANDYEYLLTLKKRIAELEKTGQTSDALTAAKKVLAEVPKEVIANVREKGQVTACDDGRLQVLEALISLAPAK